MYMTYIVTCSEFVQLANVQPRSQLQSIAVGKSLGMVLDRSQHRIFNVTAFQILEVLCT